LQLGFLPPFFPLPLLLLHRRRVLLLDVEAKEDDPPPAATAIALGVAADDAELAGDNDAEASTPAVAPAPSTWACLPEVPRLLLFLRWEGCFITRRNEMPSKASPDRRLYCGGADNRRSTLLADRLRRSFLSLIVCASLFVDFRKPEKISSTAACYTKRVWTEEWHGLGSALIFRRMGGSVRPANLHQRAFFKKRHFFRKTPPWRNVFPFFVLVLARSMKNTNYWNVKCRETFD
jgi:hypothetical protein